MGGNKDVAWSPTGFNVVVEDSKHGKVFQDTAHSVETSLVLNQKCQEELCRTICKLQDMLDNNLEEQEKIVKEQVNLFTPQSGRSLHWARKPITLFASPYFRDVRGRVPPENEDTITKRRCNDMNAYVLPPKPWSSAEHTELTKGVYENALELALAPLLKIQMYNKQKLIQRFLTKQERMKVDTLLSDVESEIEKLKSKDRQELSETMKDDLDWMKISTAHMLGVRTPEECQYMWNNFITPNINKKKFTKAEDELLRELVEEHKYRDWQSIAEKLGTERTAIQCLERFQSRINEKLLKKYWTPEEDECLAQVVAAYRVGDYIPWHKVSSHMHGRSRVQITNRWSRVKAPGILAGPWTVEEDALLYAAFLRYNNSWTKVSELIPGRTNYACRERYTSNLTPGVLTGKWTKEEDYTLLQLVSKYGEGKWSKLAQNLPGRTDSMCAQRAMCMRRANPKFYLTVTESEEAFEANKAFLKDAQFAETKSCVFINERREALQDSAIRYYYKVLSRFYDQKTLEESRKTGNIIVPSIKILKVMSDELHSGLSDRTNLTEAIPQYRPLRLRRKREESEDITSEEEEDEEDEEFDVDLLDEPVKEGNEAEESEDSDLTDIENEDFSDKVMPLSEIEKLLTHLFAPRAVAFVNNIARKCLNRYGKQATEYSVLKSKIFESFNVKSDTDDDISAMDCVHNGVDYSLSLPRMKDMFVMPLCEEGQLPCIPPNYSSITAFVTLMAIRKFTNSETALSNLSAKGHTNFFALVNDNLDADRQCASCIQSADQQLKFAQEPHPAEDLNECLCSKIREMRRSYFLLRRRFLSAFLWPSLLSMQSMPLSQIDAVICLPRQIAKRNMAQRRKTEGPPCKKRKKRGRRK